MGLFFVVYALCLVVTRPALGSLADRVGTPRVLAFGTVCFAVSYVALFYAQDLPGFLLAAVIGSAGFGCCAPLLQSMGLASVGIDRRGAARHTGLMKAAFGRETDEAIENARIYEEGEGRSLLWGAEAAA